MKLKEHFFKAVLILSIASLQTLFGQELTVEFWTDIGQRFGIMDIDYLEIADSPNGPSIIIEAESPTNHTVGALIYRPLASQKRVWGQFGCESSSPYFAQSGSVSYTIQGIGTGVKYLRVRYSKHSSNTVPVFVIINGVEVGSFQPLNQNSWDLFVYSEWLEFDIGGDSNPECEIPSEIMTSDESVNSVQITWDAVEGAETYMVKYSADTDDDCGSDEVTSTNEITLSNLAANTSYEFQVSSFCCSNGWSGWSEINTFETEENLNSSGTNQAEISVPDEVPLNLIPNPATNSVLVRLNEGSGELLQIFDLSGKMVKSIPVAGRSYLNVNIEDLKPGQYLFKVTGPGKDSLASKFVKLP